MVCAPFAGEQPISRSTGFSKKTHRRTCFLYLKEHYYSPTCYMLVIIYIFCFMYDVDSGGPS